MEKLRESLEQLVASMPDAHEFKQRVEGLFSSGSTAAVSVAASIGSTSLPGSTLGCPAPVSCTVCEVDAYANAQTGSRMDAKPTSGSARAVRCPSTAQRAATYKAKDLRWVKRRRRKERLGLWSVLPKSEGPSINVVIIAIVRGPPINKRDTELAFALTNDRPRAAPRCGLSFTIRAFTVTRRARVRQPLASRLQALRPFKPAAAAPRPRALNRPLSFPAKPSRLGSPPARRIA